MAAIKLIDIPEDVRIFILQMQTEIKCKKGTALYSQESTIYQIIKEHPRFRESKKLNTQDAPNT